MVERGALKCEKDSMGVWRWDPDLLSLVAEARDAGGDDESPEGPQRSSALAETVALLKQAHSHQEETLRLVRDPMQKLLDRYSSDNEELRKRVKELEANQDRLIEAREKLLSEQHLRDMLTADQQAQHARKDRALEFLKQTAPKLLAAVNPKAQTVVKLLQSLTDEQRGMLLETDLLTLEQKSEVLAVLGNTAPAPAPEAE